VGGASDLYASFFPAWPVDHWDVFLLRSVAGRIIDNQLDDLAANHDQPPDITLEIKDLDIVAIRNACNFIKANLESTPYFFIHTLSLRGLNCASFVLGLLRAGGADMPSISPFSMEKLGNVLCFFEAFFSRLHNYDKSISQRLKRPTSVFDLFRTNAISASYTRSIEYHFSELWINNLHLKLLDMPGAKPVFFSNYINAYMMFSYFIGLFDKDGLFPGFKISDPFSKKSTLTILFSVIIPFIYLGQSYFYERTLSPKNLGQILLDNIPEKITIQREAIQSLKSPDVNEKLIENVFLLLAGALYSALKVKQIYKSEKNIGFKEVSKYLLHFLALTTTTQFIHFNKKASYVALMMSMPVINKITAPSIGDFVYPKTKLRECSKFFLSSTGSICIIALMIILEKIYRIKYSSKEDVSIDYQEEPSVFKTIFTPKRVAIGTLAVGLGVGIWNRISPEASNQVLNQMADSISGCCYQ
jgi:hypothetical protein